MDNISKILSSFIAFLAIMIVLGSCSSQANQEVGESIDGTYTVDYRSARLGYLVMENEHYSFRQVEQSPEEISDFIFIKYPEGTFSIEYYGEITQNTLLENLQGDQILVNAHFSAYDVDNHENVEKVFLIRSNEDKKILYLCSPMGLIQWWIAAKSWRE